jgi:DNA-binding NtrC family response regulator
MRQEREDEASVPPDTDRLRPRILVLEDEPIVAIDVVDRLTEAGYDIIGPASTVSAGMDLIANVGCNAAIIDVKLGSETAEPIAQALTDRGVPFLVVTGYSQADVAPVFANARLLLKPVDSDQLVVEIERLRGQPSP